MANIEENLTAAMTKGGAAKYWARVPAAQFRLAIEEDSKMLAIPAALILTTSCGLLHQGTGTMANSGETHERARRASPRLRRTHDGWRVRIASHVSRAAVGGLMPRHCSTSAITLACGGLYRVLLLLPHRRSQAQHPTPTSGKVYVCLFVAALTISAASSITAITIGSMTYIHGKKISDEYYFEYAMSIKGRLWGEAVVYTNISMYALIIGLGFSVYLNYGLVELVVFAAVSLPFCIVIVIAKTKTHGACVEQMAKSPSEQQVAQGYRPVAQN